MITTNQPVSGGKSDVTAALPAAPTRRLLHRGLNLLGLLLGLAISGLLAWSALAVYFADTHAGPRTLRAALFLLACLVSVLCIRPYHRGLVVLAILFLSVLIWFLTLTPRNDRNWSSDSERTPWAAMDGDLVTIHNVRNFDYFTETDFTPRWEDRRYDLSQIRTADLILVYWGSPDIAHAMVSFGFADGQYLSISIETRKEKTESYSALQGFFRQYELIYIFADERDAVRLRTNFRKGEDVYLYQTGITPAQARLTFESYLHAAGELRDKPAFYNALTSNCASNVLQHARRGGLRGALTMDIVLSGHAAKQAYANGYLDNSLPLPELQKRSLVNDAARAADRAPGFSNRIRAGLPKPATVASGTSAQLSPAVTRPAPY